MLCTNKFSKDNANIFLTQAYEESRYFRNLSNYVFYIFLTFYIGIFILQINYSLMVMPLYVRIYLVSFILFSWIFVSFLLLRYHNMHGGFQEIIYVIKKRYLSYPIIFIENSNYENFHKRDFWRKTMIGKGHKEFIFYLFIFMLFNVIFLCNQELFSILLTILIKIRLIL